ncbi:hypothetical protein SAMN04489761_1044 [Tenacibaculum sp. MAR_2009_124]|uniref:DUF4258 domain-containing protein n=1 Tax=Tenacibaculum sp. MAR_2009_124 TaxID=1250059 RepID=UPI000896793B|nr:DUF4258 domain-containing protein [Tenacibaculum sp. MAR_2009_124]SEB49628.1 hypothetical protein SAMN04489761_1044 [Tenacibaculum sp. MAR_2009_124]
MQLLKRFGYYFIGVALGSMAVLYFWKNKKVTFDYGMDARTLKSIRIKKRIYSNNAKEVLQLKNIDTSYITAVLTRGDVDFSKSKPRQKPCAEYYITGKDSLESMSVYVVRCDSTATIKDIFLK